MHEELEKLRSASPACAFRVKVIPKSGRTEVAGTMSDGTVKIKVAAPPEKGKANAELCSFLAREFGVPQKNVQVIAGQTSPIKVVRVAR